MTTTAASRPRTDDGGKDAGQSAPAHSWRRLARVAALQTLCEIDIAGHSLSAVLAEKRREGRLTERGEEMLADLSAGVLDNLVKIDSAIERYTPNWHIAQMATVDRNLIRMAIYEFDIRGSAPPGAAINEAVDLARAFGSESSPRFVNGALGAVARRRTAKTAPNRARRAPSAAAETEPQGARR